MFRDQEKELERLKNALLEQDAEEEMPVGEEKTADDTREYPVYNNDTTDVDMESFGEDVYDPPKKRSLGILAFGFVLLTVAFCLLVWFIMKNGGFAE